MNEFGTRLRFLREREEMSITELAIQLDMAKSLLWRYETGKTEPGLTALVKLAEYFGVTLDWIAGNGEEDKVQYSHKKEYSDVINKCIDENIDPKKLEQLIDILRK